MSRLSRISRDDTGAAMLIALGFVTFFGVTLAAVLGFADSSLRVAGTVQDQRDSVYAADAAVEKAIADMRTDKAMGRFKGDPCGQDVPDLNGLTVQVACTADTTSGVGGTVAVKGDAIVTTATLASGEYGLYRDAAGDLAVGGNIRSNSTIELGGQGTITADGDVVAAGACDSRVTVVPPPVPPDPLGKPNTRTCGTGTLTPVPAYSSAPIEAAAGSSTPCLAPGTWVTFKPGTYKSAAALTSVTTPSLLCGAGLVYFAPGTYYFDFPPGDDVWVVNDAGLNIVGGKLVDTLVPPSDLTAPATPRPASIAFPGSCKTTAPGVQFVFGGTSRLKVDAGTIELCPAAANAGQQPIAIYGSTNVATSVTLAPTGSSGTTTFDPVGGAFTMGDGGLAKASLARDQTASLTLTRFGESAVPAGAVIQSATLRVRHQEGNPGNGGSVKEGDFASGSVTLNDGGRACTFGITKQTPLGTETRDVKACLSTPAAFTGLRATYSVTSLSQNNDKLHDYLDGVAIDVVYANPGLTPPTGCITQLGFPKDNEAAGRCALLRTAGSNTNLAVHGMVYAPKAVVDLHAANDSKQGYLGGIVARAVRANVTPSVKFPTTIAVPIPTSGPANDRLVELVATIAGRERLRATVRFKDQPAAGSTVVIERWTVSR